MKALFTITLLIAFASSAIASKEGILAFSRFRLESAGIGTSGKVVVEGNQDANGQITALTISAFSKEYIVPKDKLAKLAELHSNGIRISYEHGYPELGGRTIYIQLQMGFTSLTRMEAVVSLSENGKIEVSNIQKNND